MLKNPASSILLNRRAATDDHLVRPIRGLKTHGYHQLPLPGKRQDEDEEDDYQASKSFK